MNLFNAVFVLLNIRPHVLSVNNKQLSSECVTIEQLISMLHKLLLYIINTKRNQAYYLVVHYSLYKIRYLYCNLLKHIVLYFCDT